MVGPAVLDACVLVPISLCDVLLELADARLYQPLWSQTILDETVRALVVKLGIPEEKALGRVDAMRRAFPEAMVSGHEHLIPELTNHPKDRHVLAVAVHVGCGTIVTADAPGFRASTLETHQVTAVHPDAFLLGLTDNDPEAVRAVVERKRRLYRHPPLGMDVLCARLGKSVPRFASRLLAMDTAFDGPGRQRAQGGPDSPGVPLAPRSASGADATTPEQPPLPAARNALQRSLPRRIVG